MTSKVVFRDFNTNQAQVITSHVKLTEIEDDSGFFQYGHAEAQTLFGHSLGDAEASSFADFDESAYEFVGVQVYVDLDQGTITRVTYGIFDYLSDIGGLIFILFLIGSFLLSKVTAFFLNASILHSLFDEKLMLHQAKDNIDDLSKIKVDFSSY